MTWAKGRIWFARALLLWAAIELSLRSVDEITTRIEQWSALRQLAARTEVLRGRYIGLREKMTMPSSEPAVEKVDAEYLTKIFGKGGIAVQGISLLPTERKHGLRKVRIRITWRESRDSDFASLHQLASQIPSLRVEKLAMQAQGAQIACELQGSVLTRDALPKP